MQWLATEVLKRSILVRTKAKVEFEDLIGIDLGLKLKMYTGFSFYRFAIPEKCNYQGKSIYLDADMVVLGDIDELYHLDMNDYNALSLTQDKIKWFTSVMLMNNEKLKHWKVKEWVALINTGLASYGATMTGQPSGLNAGDFGPLPNYWNHFDFYDDTTRLIHYTNVPTQPWKKAGHPYRGAFLKELKAALDDKTVTVDDVKREIEAKHIYPAILEDMEEYVSKS
jgi:lipopolysaccharide biosynthesis glycosyltransferase